MHRKVIALLHYGQDFNAKLSGIDLTKEMLPDHITHVSTRVMGTYGYAAPEYIATGLALQNISPSHFCTLKSYLSLI